MSDFTPKELKENLAERLSYALERLAFKPKCGKYPDGADHEVVSEQRRVIEFLSSKLGPFVQGYPEWHPLNAYGYNEQGRSGGCHTQSTPKFSWMDHTHYMVNGFITCPYDHGLDELMQELNADQYLLGSTPPPALERLGKSLLGWMSQVVSLTEFRAEPLTYELLVEEFGYDGDPEALLQLYAPHAHPILVWVQWNSDDFDLSENDFRPIPQHHALPLMMSRTLADMVHASCAEDWESMQYLLVGYPHSDHLSPFIERSTMAQLRKTFETLMQCVEHRYD